MFPPLMMATVFCSGRWRRKEGGEGDGAAGFGDQLGVQRQAANGFENLVFVTVTMSST